MGGGGEVAVSLPWVDDALTVVGLGQHQVLLFLYVGLCWMSDAMEVMLVSVMAPAVACEWGISPESQSLLAGAVFLGMMLASPVWGALADVAGRRRAFGGAAVLAVAGGVASAFSSSLGWLVAARLVVGSGLVGVLPMYSLMEEWLPKRSGSKGKVLVALQVWWSIGTAFESLLALALLNSHGWRALLAASVAPLAIVIALLPLVPESPHYLAASGKRDEAVRVLEVAAALNGRSAQLRRHWEDVQQQQQQQTQEREQEQEPLLHQQPGVQDATAASHQRVVSVRAGPSTDAAHAGDDAASAAEALGPPKAKAAASEPQLGFDAGARDGAANGSQGVAGAARPNVDSGSPGSRSSWSCCGWMRHGGPCGKLGAVLGCLLSPPLRGRTCRLAVTWFASALSYYGVVMLVPLVAAGAALAGGGGGGSSGGGGGSAQAGDCLPWDADAAATADGGSSKGSHLVLPTSAYWSMLIAAAAELPSLALAFLTVDRWSRRRLVSYGLAATAAALAPLAAAAIAMRSGGGSRTYSSPPPPPPPSMPPLQGQVGHATAGFVLTGGGGGAGVGGAGGGSGGGSVTGALPFTRRRLPTTGSTTALTTAVAVAEWLPITSVTAARLFVSGAFTLLYVLTPGQYPASVRGSALGAANTLARVGAMAAPYVAVALPAHGHLAAALGVMAGACLAGAFAASGLADEG
ncbi:hypothetical protein HXX76_012769 [Chlamydomonas incerta]|uniref:Major facilitator superfamily (MFS) profile domain-containing protein n=1 Tax=Chlamydomonas incerta TaxID=51695 RepID=A0A835VT89_CHLIN|nr:hypothetical protein HXX76_012769 [Chlamydomonas incerta]|eukprot:KAG2426985.1 hypothetical protein HXX76_012769 [Chlamydomonas incerta]